MPHRISHDDGGLVRNLAPALVVSIPVAPGDEVEHGDVVAVVESMKMESSLTAPFRGRVREVLAGANVQVPAQAPLVRLEPLGDATAATANGSRVSFPASPPEAAAPGRCRDNLQRLEWLVLGYDIAEPDVARTISDLHGECADLSCDPALLPGEHRLLERFADLRALTRPGHDETDDDAGLVRSPQEHLHAYLRSLDPEAEGLPPGFVALLERALGHYGVESLDRTPALEAACYRIFLAQERAATARAAVLAILDRRLELAGDLAGRVGNDFRQALDRLVGAMEGRDPVVADLAREVRFRYFDEPLIAETRDRTYAAMDRHLEALADDPERADRDQRIGALVGCTRPLAPLIVARMHAAGPAQRRVLLEVVTRRFYRVRTLEGFTEERRDGQVLLTARYRHDGPRRQLATAFVELAELPAASAAFAAWADEVPEGDVAVADFYAWADAALPAEERAEQLRAALSLIAPAAVRAPDRGRRRRAGARPRHGGGHAVHVPPDAGRAGRGRRAPRSAPDDVPPPRAGAALRVRAERLPSAEDVYLFRGVARANAKDERLFALAEVRDLTPVRDADGRVTALPEFERMLVEALEGIRRFQAHRKPSRRLQWNRILLHVWPTIELAPEEIRALVGRLAPATAGLGVEMLLVQRRACAIPTAACASASCASSRRPGAGVVVEVDERPTAPLRAARRARAADRRRAPPRHCCIPPRSSSCSRPRDGTGRSSSTTSTSGGASVPVDRPPATNTAGIVVGLIRNATERYPEGMLRVILLGDPTRALGSLAEPECRRIIAALDLAERLGVPVEWFALSAGRQDRDGLRHREHGLDRRRAAADHRVHPGRRRDQHRRDGHQRRRAAVLERRGDDADAHQGHPRDDARRARWC